MTAATTDADGDPGHFSLRAMSPLVLANSRKPAFPGPALVGLADEMLGRARGAIGWRPERAALRRDRAMVELVRVVTWSLAYGKPARFKTIENRRRQLALLAALAPDVALLQECRPGDLFTHAPGWMAAEYLRWPARRGLAAADVTPRPTARPAPGARLALARRVLRRWVEVLPGGLIAAADIEIAGSRFAVASVHALAAPVPISEAFGEEDHLRLRRGGLDQVWHNDLIVAVLEPWVAGRRFIVGGDWNNSPLFDVNYPPPSARP
jgi:hypothetical protein